MKTAIELIREVLSKRPWCNTCEKYIDHDDIGYSGFANTPCYLRYRDCGHDVFDSDLIGDHEKMLERALDLLDAEQKRLGLTVPMAEIVD